MVAAFLEEQNLTKTVETLVKEARLDDLVAMNSAGEDMSSAIIKGEWPKVLGQVARHAFNESNEVFEALYAHIIMEMVCIGEKHLARLILDEQKELLVPNWYQDLWSVIYENKKPFTLEKMQSEEDEMPKLDDELVQNSRLMLAKLVKQKLVVLRPPSDRLIELILQAKSG